MQALRIRCLLFFTFVSRLQNLLNIPQPFPYLWESYHDSQNMNHLLCKFQLRFWRPGWI